MMLSPTIQVRNSHLTSPHLSSSSLMAHKAAVHSFQFPLFLATCLDWFQELHPNSFISFSTVLLQVVLGHPTYLYAPLVSMSMLLCNHLCLPFLAHVLKGFPSSDHHFFTDPSSLSHLQYSSVAFELKSVHSSVVHLILPPSLSSV